MYGRDPKGNLSPQHGMHVCRCGLDNLRRACATGRALHLRHCAPHLPANRTASLVVDNPLAVDRQKPGLKLLTLQSFLPLQTILKDRPNKHEKLSQHACGACGRIKRRPWMFSNGWKVSAKNLVKKTLSHEPLLRGRKALRDGCCASWSPNPWSRTTCACIV